MCFDFYTPTESHRGTWTMVAYAMRGCIQYAREVWRETNVMEPINEEINGWSTIDAIEVFIVFCVCH